MTARRQREPEDLRDTVDSLDSAKRRRTDPASYEPDPDSPSLLALALRFARTGSVMALDTAVSWILRLRDRINPSEESGPGRPARPAHSASPQEEHEPNGSIIAYEDIEELPLASSQVLQSTPCSRAISSSMFRQGSDLPVAVSGPSISTHSWKNGTSISTISTPSHFRSPSFTKSSSLRQSQSIGHVSRFSKDGHRPRTYRNRPHIYHEKHKITLDKVRAAMRLEAQTVGRKIYELHKQSGGKMTKELDEQSLLLFSESLTRLDTLAAKADQMSGSQSAVDLSTPDVHSVFDLVKSGSQCRRHSVSGGDQEEFFKLVIEKANITLQQPRPVPFTPTLDQMKIVRSRKDQEVEDLLRPKLKPPRSLTPKEEGEVDAFLKKRGTVSKFAREQVSDLDLSRLRPGQWLNDELINFYGAMLLQRSEDCKENPPKGKNTFLKVHYFSTFFWPKLKDDGYEKGRLAKWTKKFDIFQKDVVLIPVNHSNAHWTGAAINFRLKRIESYDSMGTERQVVFRLLRTYLDQEHRNKKKAPFDFTGWEHHSITSPTQENGYDCGVFTCQYLQGLSRGDEYVRFSQSDMPNLRRRMIWEIGHGRLHDEP